MAKECNFEGCTNPRFGGGYCSWHQWKRKDKKTKAKTLVYRPEKKRKPIRKFSKKMAAQLRIYNPRAKVYKEENPLCEARIPGICQYYTSDVHHKKGRGKYLLLEYTWMPICRMCHTWIDENPIEAKKLGLVI